MTEIHVLLLTLFTLLMTMDFSSLDILLDVDVLMVLLGWLCVYFTPYLLYTRGSSQCYPYLDLDVQLVTHLMLMMEKSCPECIIRNYCCNISNDLPI